MILSELMPTCLVNASLFLSHTFADNILLQVMNTSSDHHLNFFLMLPGSLLASHKVVVGANTATLAEHNSLRRDSTNN